MRSRSVPGFRQRGRAGRLVAGSAGVLLALGALFAPVEIPDRVEGMARVLPAQEWILARTATGAVTSTLRDHRTGAVSTVFAAEPARGDAVRFELEPVASSEAVEAGDVVGVVASGEAALRLSVVRGEIDQAQAELRLSLAGSKEDIVEAARQDVRRAEVERAQAEATAVRARGLFARGLTAAQALEEAESAVGVAEASVAAAEARVRAVASGDRVEEAAVVRARILALEREAESLVQREEMGTLVSPISGRVYRVFSPDTLLLVANTSAYRVLMPVRWSDRDRVRVGSTMTLGAGGEDGPVARVVDVREAAAPRAGQAYLVATADVVAGGERLAPGLLVPSAIEAPAMTPLGHARRAFANLFAW